MYAPINDISQILLVAPVRCLHTLIFVLFSDKFFDAYGCKN
jgi:hypothetical protein